MRATKGQRWHARVVVCSQWLFALWVGTACAREVDAANFHWNFEDGQAAARFLEPVGGVEGHIERSSRGLVVTIPKGLGHPDPMGFILGFGLHGDFEVTADYEILGGDQPLEGHGSGVGLLARGSRSARETITMERFRLPKGGEKFHSTLITTLPDGQRRYRVEENASLDRSGRVKLVRHGGHVSAQYSDGSGPLRTLRDVNFTTDDLWEIRFAADSGRSDAALQVLLKQISVQADSFLERPGVAPQVPSGRLWAVAALVYGGISLAVVAIALSRKRSPMTRPERGQADAVSLERLRAVPGVRSTILAAALCVLIVSVFNHTFAARSNEPHIDERDWSARAYFYRLAFINHDLSHTLWTDFDGRDQPHVTDFLVGAVLHICGKPVPPVPSHTTPWSHDPVPSAELLKIVRIPGTILGSLVAVVIFAIGTIVTNRVVVGLVAGLVYACHPLALDCQPMAMSDAPLMFFSTLSILMAILAVPGSTTTDGETISRQPWAAIVFAALFAGLALGAKLTGLFTGLVVVLILALLQRKWTCFLIFVSLALFWSVAVNPTLYTDPVGEFLAMIRQRSAVAESQASRLTQYQINGLETRLFTVYEFLSGAGTHRPISWPITGLACAGVAAVAAQALGSPLGKRLDRRYAALLIWSAVLMGTLAPSLPLRWERYYLPFLPCWSLFVGVGGWVLWVGARKAWERTSDFAAGSPAKKACWLAIAVAVPVALLAVDPIERSFHRSIGLGKDFAALQAGIRAIAAGWGGSSYDPATLAAFDRATRGREHQHARAYRLTPPPCPPAFLLTVAPFAALEPSIGFLTWVAACVAVVLALAQRPMRPIGEAAWPIAGLSLLFLPLGVMLGVGSITVLAIVGFYFTQRSFARGAEGWAGLWAGLLWVRPEFGAALSLVFLWRRRWRAAFGMAIACLLIGLASLATAGTSGSRAFLSSLRPFCGSGALSTDADRETLVNAHAFVRRWLPESIVARWESVSWYLVPAIGVGAIALVWRGPWRPSTDWFSTRLLATASIAVLAASRGDLAMAAVLLAPGIHLVAIGRASPTLGALLLLGFLGPLVCLQVGGWTLGDSQAFTIWMVAIVVVTIKHVPSGEPGTCPVVA